MLGRPPGPIRLSYRLMEAVSPVHIPEKVTDRDGKWYTDSEPGLGLGLGLGFVFLPPGRVPRNG